MPLHALIRRAGLRRIDLFSLDVEGYELAALRTMDWSVPVGVFVIETDKLSEDDAGELRALLERHGYTFVRRMGSKRRNQLWVGSELLPSVRGVVGREQRVGVLEIEARRPASSLRYPHEALVRVMPNQGGSCQRPVMRGQTRFVGQGATECPPTRVHAPDAEDEHVFRRYFSRNGSEPFVRNGTFVEMGAYNGVTFSNTLFFERELGWHGLLVEANPPSFTELQRTRGGRGRGARNTLLNAAVCAVLGEDAVRMVGKGPNSRAVANSTTSGAPSTLVSASHKKAEPVWSVPCMPLHEMLRRAGLRRIDLFSLDVEGYELAALRTMDWSVPVGVFVIETAKLQADEEDNELRALLERHGYAFMQHMGAKRSHALWRHTG